MSPHAHLVALLAEANDARDIAFRTGNAADHLVADIFVDLLPERLALRIACDEARERLEGRARGDG